MHFLRPYFPLLPKAGCVSISASIVIAVIHIVSCRPAFAGRKRLNDTDRDSREESGGGGVRGKKNRATMGSKGAPGIATFFGKQRPAGGQ